MTVVPTRSVPTLPPTWTPRPQPTHRADVAALPLPIGLTGRLAVWGGQDELSIGYLPLGYYDFDSGMQYTQHRQFARRRISRFSADGQRVVYTVYDHTAVLLVAGSDQPERHADRIAAGALAGGTEHLSRRSSRVTADPSSSTIVVRRDDR